MELILSLLQQMSVYLIIAYFLTKTPLFMPLMTSPLKLRDKFFCYLLFSIFCILGSYFGLHIEGAIANTRAMGAVLGGLIGGPVVGFGVGLTGGLHRYSLGGFTDIACAISTTAEGLIGGLAHYYYAKKNKQEQIFNPVNAFLITLNAEAIQMLILLTVTASFDKSLTLVQKIAAPMLITNSIGAAFFISIINDRKTIYERYSASFSNRALRIAERSIGAFHLGYTLEACQKVAKIVFEETGVAAVALTDRTHVMAFIGLGSDHHKAGFPISSSHTKKAIAEHKLIYTGGDEGAYKCDISPHCPLGSALVIPLMRDDHVIGAIKLYEPKRKIFSAINYSMGEGIAKLLSAQLLAESYQEQKILLTQAELRLLQAQINPHFLFNALNTISAIIKRDADEAKTLIQYLSQFLRANLKQKAPFISLKEEIEHVNAYLTIELARFSDRLSVDFEIDSALLDIKIPTFTLQPLVENAIKHGISHMLDVGKIKICATQTQDRILLTVADNAGAFDPKKMIPGIGINNIDQRIKHNFGDEFGLEINLSDDNWTKAVIRLPKEILR